MEQEKKSYGKLQIKDESNFPMREIDIINFAKFNFKDNRLVSICETEENTFVIAVENPQSTGRTNQTIHLSKPSFLAFFTAIGMYFQMKDIRINEEFENFVKSDFVDYEITPELKRLNPKDL